MKHVKLISVVLAIAAITPWVFSLIEFVNSISASPRVHSVSYEVLRSNGNIGNDWKFYWHVTMLLIFSIMLFKTASIPRKRKASWLFGFLFFWPVVSLYFIWRTFFTLETKNGITQGEISK